MENISFLIKILIENNVINRDLRVSLEYYFLDVLLVSYNKELTDKENVVNILSKGLEENFSFENKLLIRSIIEKIKNNTDFSCKNQLLVRTLIEKDEEIKNV